MQVTISGDIGSGKSTAGQYLANVLGAEFIDCGQLYRQYASKRDMNVLQLNQSGDNSIDVQIDNDLIRMGKEDFNRVYVSRTAWHFVPNAKHIYMSVNPLTAARRILQRKTTAETHDTIKSVLKYNKDRIDEEDKRYFSMYGVTRQQQLEEADILMCIGNVDVDCVCRALSIMLNKGKVLCFDPRTAVPTQVLHDISVDTVNMYKKELSDIKSDVVECEVKIQVVNGITYIVDGHHRVAAACQSGVKLMYTHSYSLPLLPVCKLSNSDYYDWEDYIHGDMSAVTGVITDPMHKFVDAASKM